MSARVPTRVTAALSRPGGIPATLKRRIDRPAGGAHKPEFDAWRWESPAALPGLIVPFKRQVYEDVVAAFASYLPG